MPATIILGVSIKAGYRRFTSSYLVSFAAVFRDVTQRSPERGALRDIPKDGCEGDYPYVSLFGLYF